MSMNIVGMPGPNHARNFFDSQISHNKKQESHNRNVEWMMIANLLQQERMIQGQNQQILQMQARDEREERNRRLDVYAAEFIHRGLGPLEAQTCATQELEFVELMEYVTNFVMQTENQTARAEEIVTSEVKVKYGVVPVKKYKSKIEIKKAAENLRILLASDLQQVFENAASRLNVLPFSNLFDDEPFRIKVEQSSGIPVKMPQFQESEGKDELLFSDANVVELYDEYKSLRSRWKTINSTEEWNEAIQFLPEFILDRNASLTSTIESIEEFFLSLKVIAKDGGYSASDTSDYLGKIVDQLNSWQDQSVTFVEDLETYILGLGDSPIGVKLKRLILD